MRTLIVSLLTLTSAAGADVTAILTEFDRVSSRAEWPGFDPHSIPVAVYDGNRTWLYRHPSPPSEFHAVDGHPGLFASVGRHPAMQANTSAEIGGALTATLMIDASDRSPLENAAILTHECFHVYQRRHHPAWQGNEAVLFTYPVEDADAAALALLEQEALRHALNSKTACWASRFVETRRQRFARLPAEAVAYERATELNEGLAQYVQDRVGGRQPDLARTFQPGDVRGRAYVIGEAVAFILDKTAPGWKSRVQDSLEELLPSPPDPACDFTAAERQTSVQQGRNVVAALLQRRHDAERTFESAPGWRVVVEASTQHPLRLQGFDPMNVERLTDKVVLHKRLLKLGNAGGSLEMLKAQSITVAAGTHPLFGGVRSWTILLESKPSVTVDGKTVKIEAPGLNGSFSDASAETQGQRIIIRVN
jgi:hypothetical protein